MKYSPLGNLGERPVDVANVNTASKEINPTVREFEKALGREDFEHVINSLKAMSTELTSTRLEFKIHDETKRIMVRIYDKATDELISEIPPEKFMDLLAGLWKQAGLIVDELIGQQEIVIKSLGKLLAGIRGIAGATILGNGEVALILDVGALM